MPVTITTRLAEETVKVLDEVAREEAGDRSTAVRKLLQQATKEWLIQKSLANYEQGKCTLWQAAKQAGVSLWEIIEEVKRQDIRVPYTLSDLQKDLAGL